MACTGLHEACRGPARGLHGQNGSQEACTGLAKLMRQAHSVALEYVSFYMYIQKMMYPRMHKYFASTNILLFIIICKYALCFSSANFLLWI